MFGWPPEHLFRVSVLLCLVESAQITNQGPFFLRLSTFNFISPFVSKIFVSLQVNGVVAAALPFSGDDFRQMQFTNDE